MSVRNLGRNAAAAWLIALSAGTRSAPAAEPAVAPGAQAPALGEVRVEGGQAIKTKEFLKILPVKRGQPADERQRSLAREIAASLMQNKGYLESEASARLEVWPSSAVFVLSVREGPLYRFGKTRFEGLSRLSARALRHELSWDEGAAYERPQVLRAQGRLFGLGLFEDVEVSVSTTPAKTAEVLIRVKERPLKWIKTGVGWGSEERERLSLTLTHNNLLGRAYTGEFSALYSHIWVDYRGEFVNRHFWGTDAEQRTSVSWRRENRQGYDLERTRGQLSWSVALPRRWRLTGQYRAQSVALYNVDPEISAAEEPRPLASGLSAALDRDTTDDYFFPSRGVRAGLLLERQGGFLRGDVDLNRASAHAAAYERLWRGLIGAVTATGGVVRQFAPSATVPIYERSFMGGATSVRGFRERDIGPKDSLGNPIGGNVFTRGGLELRFPLWRRLGGALFLDGGQVDPDERLVWPALWKWGAGPGLRVRTPVGPLRLDFGYKVNPDPGPVSRWTFHLSLGEAF